MTESVGGLQGSSDVTTVLDSDEQEEEEEEVEERSREGTDPLEQHHENLRVIEPPAPHRLEDDANSEDFQEPAAKRKKRNSLTTRGSATHDEESKLNVSTDDVSWRTDGYTCLLYTSPSPRDS